jgi:hypothetical protein
LNAGLISGDLHQVQLRREEMECVLLLADVAGTGISASPLTPSSKPSPRDRLEV